MKITVLDSGLFPDRGAVEEAVDTIQPPCRLARWDLRASGLDSRDWDRILEDILNTDGVIVV